MILYFIWANYKYYQELFAFHPDKIYNKQNICLQIEFLCLLSLTRVIDNQGGLGLGQVSVAIMFNPPLRFLTSHMNSQAMCLPFVSTAES